MKLLAECFGHYNKKGKREDTVNLKSGSQTAESLKPDDATEGFSTFTRSNSSLSEMCAQRLPFVKEADVHKNTNHSTVRKRLGLFYLTY